MYFISSRRRHTRYWRDWSSDVCSSDLEHPFESTFQLRALRYFIRALREEGLRGRELSVTTYLVGELNRRLGNHREALNWYVNAERTLGDGAGLAWLDRLISQQSKLRSEERRVGKECRSRW